LISIITTMFYYKDKIPPKDSIVVASFDLGEDSEACIYVKLPEYNNCKGIIYRTELPKRLKLQKKAINDMKRTESIVCIVTNSPKMDAEGRPELVELSMKGVDAKYHADIIIRFKNTVRILKLFKLLAMQHNLSFDDIVEEVRSQYMATMYEIDEHEGVDTLTQTYNSLLRNPSLVADLTKADASKGELYQKIVHTVQSAIRETNASTTLEFDIAVWKRDKDGRDAVYTLRDLFSHVKDSFKEETVDVRYVGAPRYQITVRSITPEKIDSLYATINKAMVDWLADKGVSGYDLKYDSQQKVVQSGELNIAYPFQIDMEDE
ncbi:Eukaryotic Initiation Factor, partial [Yasminevirus sp. GU-2018]